MFGVWVEMNLGLLILSLLFCFVFILQRFLLDGGAQGKKTKSGNIEKHRITEILIAKEVGSNE